jgi:BolA-like protein 1
VRGAVPTLLDKGAPRRASTAARSVAAAAQSASDLPPNLRTIVSAFQMVPDPMSRYKQLLFFASKLEGLDDSKKLDANKVQVRLAISAG